jgi:hypothetical protein
MMAGVILLIVSFFAMCAWFAYLAYKDPANLFKRRPSERDPGEQPPKD